MSDSGIAATAKADPGEATARRPSRGRPAPGISPRPTQADPITCSDPKCGYTYTNGIRCPMHPRRPA
jgi:hypothetical protein